ncbi:aspartate dehydrogenase [Candidatus Bathyarchaeota archaeon]|nr:aspartate dehydrogenase [Candidatus Bathyarchaeota archaeon]
MGAGLIGCGAIGTVIAEAIDRGKAGDINLIIVYDLIRDRSELLASRLSHKPLIAEGLNDILERKDVHLVIEAASQEAVRQYATKILSSNKDLMIMSAGALVDDNLFAEIIKVARENGRKVYVPSGAIVGLDNIKSASVGQIEEVTLTTRKPPISFRGAPYVEKSKIDLSSLKEPLILFDGPAREAVKLFPQNVNVAATLSLAGIGADRTRVRVIVDPTIKNIIHEIYVRGEFGEIYTKTVNRPFPTNPKTSYIAALSAIATLRKISENIIVGT